MGKVLHASKSGWFPICIQTELPPILDLEARYSGEANSLDLMMAIYWRVKEWEIQFSSATIDPAFIVSSTGVYGFDANNEEDLVCAPPFIEKSFTSNYFSFQEHSFFLLSLLANLYYGITSLDNNETFNFAYSLLYRAADDLTVGGEISSGHVGAGIYDTLSFPIANVGICNLKITKIPDISSNYATISILPKSYWSYGGTYDTNTGLPLT